jgi:uncharacterized protein
MNPIDKRILDFIKKHHVLTLATSCNNKPWCANCFYAFLSENNQLVFTSDNTTRHVIESSQNPEVAGSIVLETSVIGKIQGIQFSGNMRKPEKNEASNIRFTYLKRFPFAVLMNTNLWIIDLTYIKFTDNRLGFGRKLIWEK